MCFCTVFPQNQLSACTKALESSEELLEVTNQTLCSSEMDGFTQVRTHSECGRFLSVNLVIRWIVWLKIKLTAEEKRNIGVVCLRYVQLKITFCLCSFLAHKEVIFVHTIIFIKKLSSTKSQSNIHDFKHGKNSHCRTFLIIFNSDPC